MDAHLHNNYASLYLSCAKRTSDNFSPHVMGFPYGSQLLLGQEDVRKLKAAYSAFAAEFSNLLNK